MQTSIISGLQNQFYSNKIFRGAGTLVATAAVGFFTSPYILAAGVAIAGAAWLLRDRCRPLTSLETESQSLYSKMEDCIDIYRKRLCWIIPRFARFRSSLAA